MSVAASLHLASSTAALGPVGEVAGFESGISQDVNSEGIREKHFLCKNVLEGRRGRQENKKKQRKYL
jgi:hypothetical protein